MIHTITLNPSIDMTLRCEKIHLGKIHKIRDVQEQPGGKGMNVSVALKNLGIETVSWVFLGGFNGQKWSRLATPFNLRIESVPMNEESRRNVKVFETEHSRQTDFNSVGPEFDETAYDIFLTRFAAEITPGDTVVIAGSPLRNTPVEAWVRLVNTVYSEGARLVVDMTGKGLSETAARNPWLLRFNRDEFNEWQGTNRMGLNEIGRYWRESGSSSSIVVTDGERGALGVSEQKQVFFVAAPGVEIQGTVGAGDAFTAGWLAGWTESRGDWQEAMRWGAATAAGAVELSGTRFPSLDRVLERIADVRVEKWN